MRIPRSFSSLRSRNFRLFFVGQTVSVAGTWMQNVGLSWLVLELSGSGSVLGAFIGLRYLPVLVLGSVGGLVADKLDKRRLMFLTQISSGLASALVALLVTLDVANVAVVFALGLLIGLVNVFEVPGRQAMIYEMVDEEDLTSAVSLTAILANIARVVGPVLAGFLIAWSGVSGCFVANALSYVPVVICLYLMAPEELRKSPPVGRGTGQIRAGFRYALHEPQIAVPLVLVAVAGAFAWEFQVTLPLLAKHAFEGDASTFGLMLACIGMGAVVGGLATAGRARVTTGVLALAATGWGLSIMAVAAAPTLLTAYLLLLAVGYGTITFNSLSKVCLQLASDPQMRGRVMALWSIAWQGTTPIGGPLVGWVGEMFGSRWSLVAGGLPTLVAGLWAVWYLRRLTRPGPVGTEAEPKLGPG